MRTAITAILLALLTACGTASLEPSNQLVQRALSVDLEQSQQQLSQQLKSDANGFEISQLVINQQEPLVIQNLPAYHIRGTYNLTLKLPRRRVTQQQNPFDIYLQRQKEGKTWRLALPQSTNKDAGRLWRTYLIR